MQAPVILIIMRTPIILQQYAKQLFFFVITASWPENSLVYTRLLTEF